MADFEVIGVPPNPGVMGAAQLVFRPKLSGLQARRIREHGIPTLRLVKHSPQEHAFLLDEEHVGADMTPERLLQIADDARKVLLALGNSAIVRLEAHTIAS